MQPILVSTLIVFSLSLCCWGQNATGTLQGRVTDPSGAAVPDAQIAIENAGTGMRQVLSTNSEGRFAQPYLLPGEYQLTVEKSGFQRYLANAIPVAIGQTVTLDVSLTVGTVASTLEVVANAVQLASASSSVSTVIDTKGLQDLPINTRNPIFLTLVTPGVVPTSPCYPDRSGCRSSGTTLWSGASPWIAGGRFGTSDMTIDGTSVMTTGQDPGDWAPIYTPASDAVEEFAVLSNALPAEYGWTGGGVVNFATRSGTNRFHASAFEFFRNHVLDANDFFANRNGIPLGFSRRNQYGGTAGGPVDIPKVYDGRNRTFVFFSMQSTRNPQQSLFTTTVPTAQWLQGDFSNLKNSAGQAITVYDPMNGSTNSAGAFIRQAFPNNVIPASRFDPVSAKARAYFVAPNAVPTNPYTQTGNFVTNRIITNNDDRYDLRIDHNFSERLRVFVRGSLLHYISTPTNIYGNPGTPYDDGVRESHNRDVALNAIYTLNSSTVLNFNFGSGTWMDTRIPFSEGFDYSQLGLPSSLVSQWSSKASLEFPGINIAGLTSTLGGTSLGQLSGTWLKVHPISYVGRSDLSKMKGNHTIKFGVEYRKLFLDQLQTGYSSGTYTFNSDWTQQNPATASSTQGFGMASYLLGTISSGYMDHRADGDMWSKYLGVYVQDDWHVTTRLTFNLGLRWDVGFPREDNHNQLSYFNMSAPSPIAGQVPGYPNLLGAMEFVTPSNRQQTPTDLSDWGPRFGFAYKLDEKTVIRGAYTVMYAPTPLQASSSASAGMEGFTTQSTVVPSYDANHTPAAFLSNPFPNGLNLPRGSVQGPNSGAATDLGLTITSVFNGYYSTPRVQQWNFNVQRELAHGFMIEAGYLGLKGQHLADAEGSLTFNQLPPSYASLGNALNAQVPNPFYGTITNPTSILSKPTVVYSQLLRPYPQYAAINAANKPNANSNYQAFTLRAEKKLASGLSLLVSYADQKLLDDSSSGATWIGNSGNKQDFYNRHLEKSVSAMDVPQRFTISGTYELPFGRTKHFLSGIPRAANFFVGGWQTNAILTEQSGEPIIISQNQNTTYLGSSSQRPNYTANPTESGSAANKLNQWFNTSVFAYAQAFAFGNVPRTLPSTRSYGTHTLDFSLFKNFHIKESGNIQFRAEAFNVSNTPQFSWPGQQLGASGFGVVTSVAGAPRQIQLALKASF
jgi:hypothetical protein